MTQIEYDWTAAEAPNCKAEGIYHAEIVEAESKTSRNDDPMIVLKLKDVDDHKHLCYDIVMLAGVGARIGRKKLLAIGCRKGEPLDTTRMVGQRVWCQVKHDEYKGETQCKVDINANDSMCGYWNHDPRQQPKPEEPVPF